MDLQTELYHQYFLESCKIFIAYATITDVNLDGIILSVFSRGDGNCSPLMSVKSSELPMELPMEYEFQSASN
jgi:hypothetical protein